MPEHVRLSVDNRTAIWAGGTGEWQRVSDLGTVPARQHWHLHRVQFSLARIAFAGAPAYLLQLVEGSRPGVGNPAAAGDGDPSWVNATGRRSDVVAASLVDLDGSRTREVSADDDNVRAHLGPGTQLWLTLQSDPVASLFAAPPYRWSACFDFVASAVPLAKWG